ncbi:tyrosine-protein phosphatase [Pseudoclavibacter terrae]|uniref:tyrosine-protein phosphatase n=1 Tax=Pseudoclavibacter terrae TaxID=1530195 RepID=UPI002330E46A|nr:tyrosine-protein phosphatase [Pseudoclavibacter terrae]
MRAIEIDGLFNARAADAASPWIVRAGSPDALSIDGESALRALGVELILDLRERAESGERAHGVPVRQVPLYGSEPPVAGRLEDIYETLLRRRGGALTEAVAVLANAERGVLVHCTAGKDRTGLVVALAQLVAGAREADVVRDYALSGVAVRSVREAFAFAVADAYPSDQRDEILRLHLDSPPEALEHALGIVRELGGAEAYLRSHGLTEEQVRALRAKSGRTTSSALASSVATVALGSSVASVASASQVAPASSASRASSVAPTPPVAS